MRTCFVFLNPDFYVQYLLVTAEAPAIYVAFDNSSNRWFTRATASAEQDKRYNARCDKTPHCVKDIMRGGEMAFLRM